MYACATLMVTFVQQKYHILRKWELFLSAKKHPLPQEETFFHVITLYSVKN